MTFTVETEHCYEGGPGLGPITYAYITKAKVDRYGNLRLYRRGRFFDRQDIFHPAREWITCRKWVTSEDLPADIRARAAR